MTLRIPVVKYIEENTQMTNSFKYTGNIKEENMHFTDDSKNTREIIIQRKQVYDRSL